MTPEEVRLLEIERRIALLERLLQTLEDQLRMILQAVVNKT